MTGLFERDEDRPLADRLRPRGLEDVVGQDHLLAPTAPLGRMLAGARLVSCILWGPPGCGKTTIARLLADHTSLHFEPLSAVFSGVADLRKVFDAARKRRESGQGTLLFVDEIHRFNRAQQDSFLPYVEDGTVVLVGATTENPSFELNGALLSRSQVLVLHRLDEAALEILVTRAEAAIDHALPLDGDARAALKLHQQYYPLFKDLFIETNPVPVKAALALMGQIEEEYRLPLVAMSAANREKLRKTLKTVGVLK